jgi:hypothetical protein
VGPAVTKEVRATWASASSLGTAAERIIAETFLSPERDLWKAAGGLHPGAVFIARARSRAQWIVGVTYTILGIGILLFGIGLINAISEWQAAQTSQLGF